MQVLLRWGGLVLVVALVLPVIAADPEKPEPKPKPEVKAKWVANGQLQGKLVKIEGATYVIQIAGKVPQVAGGKLTFKDVTKDYPVELTEDCKVRLPTPPLNFDSKGNIKQYTAQELQQLKGPEKNLPGYPGDVADLKPGMIVQAKLVKKQEPVRPGVPPRPKPGTAPADAPVERPITNLIIVLQDPTQVDPKAKK